MKDIKIVVVSSTALSEPVTKNRLLPFLNELLLRKMTVALVCPKSPAETHAHPKEVELIEVNLDTAKPTSFIKRALKEAMDVRALLKAAKKEQAQGYLITIPSMFLAFFTPFLLSKKITFLDIRDLPWEYLSDNNTLQRLSKRLFRFIFEKTLNTYNLVAVTNPTEIGYVTKIWKGNNPPLLISNGIMQSQFEKLVNVVPSTSQQLIITYIGNIGIAQHLETLIEAAEKLPEVLFKIVGTGIEHSKIESLIVENKINNVELVGRVHWEKVKDYYDSTHILYAQLTPEFSGAMPSKLYEYLSTGKHIIYAGQGQAEDKLNEFGSNIVIPPCNVKELVDSIELIKTSEHLSEINTQNRNLIKRHYLREDGASELVNNIESILSNAVTSNT